MLLGSMPALRDGDFASQMLTPGLGLHVTHTGTGNHCC